MEISASRSSRNPRRYCSPTASSLRSSRRFCTAKARATPTKTTTTSLAKATRAGIAYNFSRRPDAIVQTRGSPSERNMAMHVDEEELAAAEAYEKLHVPALFRRWAPVVLDSAALRQGDRILDVACGTGVLAREARARFGDSCSIIGLDAAAGMLAVARDLEPSIEWRQGSAESLPFEDAAFDVVVSQFGLMFFQDRSAAVREMLRVLAPGGRLAVAVWDSLYNSEAYPLEVDLLERRAGRDAADALRAPFVLGDKADLINIFSAAGAESIEIVTRDGSARFPGIRSMVEADLRGWLPVMGVFLPEKLIEDILEEAEQVLSAYVTEAGTVEFNSPAHVVTVTSSG